MQRSARHSPDPSGEFPLRRVADLLGLPATRVRALARAAGLTGSHFSFQDVVVLRSLAGLVAARVSPRSMRGALERLQRSGESLAQVRLSAQGGHVLVRDDAGLWDAHTGQGCLDFAPAASSADAPVVSLAARTPAPAPAATPVVAARSPEAAPPENLATLEVDDWFDLAQSAEKDDPLAALEAYQQVLARQPHHYPALINVGRLFHETGEPARAEAAYQAALAAEPHLPLARFNLAVLLDDTGRTDEAVEAYRATIAADPAFADAHFNLARLLEKAGDKLGAVRHLSRYRQLCK